MTDEQKTTQEESSTPFEDMPFAAMMQKMMGQQGNGCGCAEMMSQMTTMCGGVQNEEEKTTTKTTQKV